jgi:hypothetical protein
MYPEQEARRAILRNLKHRLEDRDAYSSLELDLRLRGEVSSIAEDCGLSLEEAARILRMLAEERYIHAEFGSPTGMYSFNMVKVYDLLDRGRIEIGDLPDPQERFVAGLEKAIAAIRADQTLSDETKERRIRLAQGAIDFVRETGSHVAANIIAGGLT